MTRVNETYPVPGWIDAAERVAYRDLPAAHQKAIAHYMAIDGEAWGNYWQPRYGEYPAFDAPAYWADHLHRYVTEHGHRRFAVLDLPAGTLAQAITTHNTEVAQISGGDWAAYCAWYAQFIDTDTQQGRGVPAGSGELWPVILDHDNHDVIQDGWHRLHDYVGRGLTRIPAVGYLPGETYSE